MARPTDIRVLFVRTPESEWERAGRVAGSTDVPVTPAGWSCLTEAMGALGDVRLQSVLCGPDEASQEVARKVAKAAGCRIKVVEDLGEVHLGLWEGMLHGELEDKCPRAYRQWMEDPATVHVPEGEGLEDAQARIAAAISRNLGRVKGDSGAVGVVLRPMARALVGCALSGVPMRNLWSMMDSSPILEWRTVERETMKDAHVRAGVGA